MKLYVPATADTAITTLPSRWTAASNNLAGSDGNGTSWHDGLVDSKVLPFHRLTMRPISPAATLASGTITLNFAATGAPNITMYQWFVCGIEFASAGTVDYEAIVNAAIFAGSAYRTADWIGPYSGNTELTIPYIYVYRPSTQAVVGTLAWLNGAANFKYLATIGVGLPGAYRNSNGPSYQWNEVIGVTNRARYTQADVAVLAGDILCYEVWLGARSPTSDTDINYSVALDCGWNGSSLADAPWGDSSTTTGGKSTYFYIDDLQALTYPVPTFVPDPATPANLTNVDPGAGPKISLTFDNPVGVIGPTIGPGVSGLAVTGVTAVDSTHIDLDLAVAPTEVLAGSAQGCDVLPAPTGGTAWDGAPGGGV